MTNKYLKYIHPAAMKYDLKKSYELDELKKELDLDMIKVLFIPVNFKWDDLEIKNKSIKIEEKKEDLS